MNAENSTTSLTEADILQRAFEAEFRELPPALARRVLALELAASDREMIDELSARARAGILTKKEDEQLERYLRVGHFLSILKSKARQVLKKH